MIIVVAGTLAAAAFTMQPSLLLRRPVQSIPALVMDDDFGKDPDATAADPDLLASATTYAGLAANPVALASLVSLSSTGCGLPKGPFGLLGAIETLSYLIIAGIVFSWTPEEGGIGSAGLGLGERDVESAPPGGPSLQGAVEIVSFFVFLAAFLLLVQSIVAPVGGPPGACGDMMGTVDTSDLTF